MREVVATLFSSVDGYATGRDPEDMDWAVDYQGPEMLRLGLDAIRGSEPLAWQSTTLNRGDVAAEIPKLKQQPGKDIGIRGSVALVRSLLQQGLLDHHTAPARSRT